MRTKTNPYLKDLIKNLKIQSNEQKVKIWKDIAERLDRPLKNWAVVNVSKIERFAKDNEYILVPGKVLGTGNLSKKVNVIAYAFSEEARDKIVSAGGKILKIEDIMISNPKGSNIRIFG